MVMTNSKAFAKKAKSRSYIYGLLSHIYSREPSLSLLERLKDSTFTQLLKELGSDLSEELKRRPLDEAVEELAVEYTRLFIGPGGHIYPYQSAYRKENADRPHAISQQIESFIKWHGLEYDPDFHEAHDHISVELAFMEKATDTEARAWSKDGGKDVVEIIKLEKQFIEEYAVQWVPEFSNRVIKAAHLGFYREIARLTKAFILSEAQEIKDTIEQIAV